MSTKENFNITHSFGNNNHGDVIMKNSSIKINARIINISYGVKSCLFTLFSLSAKLFFALSTVFCSFTLYIFINSDLNGRDTLADILYYVLFSMGIAFSICFYILCGHSVRRAFFKTTLEKGKFELFNLMSVKLQLKIIYLHLLRFFRNLFCAVFYLSPAVITGLAALYFLRDGIDRALFFALLSLFTFFLLSGIFFALASAQRLALLDETICQNPHLSAADMLKAAKDNTNGRCFKLAKFKLSFLPKLSLCILIVPSFFVIPYYLRSISIYAKQALKFKTPKPVKEAPIIITKIIPDTV